MGKFARHQPRGNVARDIQSAKKRIKLEGTAKSLAASAIGAGGVNVKEGANIVIEDGGGLRILDGGFILAKYDDSDATGFFYGKILYSDTDEAAGHGLIVQTNEDPGTNILTVAEYVDGTSYAAVGHPSYPVDGFNVAAKNIILDAQAGGGSTYITHTTTGLSSPACIINTNGSIQRSTSALKYKQDIEDADVDGLADAVLRMRVRTWRDRAAVERDPDFQARYVGFVAEEADEDGMGVLVYRDPDTDEVEAFSYPQMTAPLTALAQRQQREIHELGSRVDVLESGLAAERARVDAQDSLIAALTARLDALEARNGMAGS